MLYKPFIKQLFIVATDVSKPLQLLKGVIYKKFAEDV